MKSVLYISLLTTVLFLTACTKHYGDVEAPEPAVKVSFTLPTIGAVYQKNEAVTIQAVAIANHTLHGYDLVIKNASDTTVYFTKHVHDHNDTLQINQVWKNDLNIAANLEAQVTFALDHDGNKYTKSVGFKIR